MSDREPIPFVPADGATLPLDPNATVHLSKIKPAQGLAKFPLPNWDHFEPLAFLGEGGMGRVFKARDPRLNRLVALKFIRGDDEELLRRFQVEARSQALIEHPHVCKVYEVGEVEGQAYIAMQFIEGKSLADARASLNIEEKVTVMLEVAEAIHAAHRQGIIHRDLKPANIMLERSEQGRWWPYVMDFGLAKGNDGAGMTLSGVAMGTPPYMPPEQVLGRTEEIDRRTDVYSLGATLYDLLVGEPPFKGPSVTELFIKVVKEEPRPLRAFQPSLPGDLETIVLKCLEKEPQRRYDSAKALAEDLRRFLDGEPIQARPASVIYRLKKRLRKNRALSSAILLSALLGLGFAAWGVRATLRAQRQTQLANRFALEVKAIEDTMRVAYLRPLHDVRAEKAKVRARMERLRNELARLGSIGAGPGGHALGLGHMAMGEMRQARITFQAAWDAEYRPPQLALALGQALAAEFETERFAALQLPKEEQEARQVDLRQRLLNPATNLLSTYLGRVRQARMSAPPGYAFAGGSTEETIEGVGYLEALLFHLQDRDDEAIRKARIAFLQDPGIYAAKRLEAQSLMALAQKARNAGDLTKAAAQLEEAGRALAEARELARSDGSLWRWEAERRMALAALGVGRDPLPTTEKAYRSGIEACEQALACDPDDTEAMRRAAEAWHDMATYQLDGGRDNLPALGKAKALLDQALVLKGGEGELWYLLGRVSYAMARAQDFRGIGSVEAYVQAVRAYQEAQTRGREASERSALACLFKAFFQDAHGLDPGPALLEAETLIRRARQFREDRFSLNTMGLVLGALGRWRMAQGESAEALLAEARTCFKTGYERYHAFASLRNLADIWRLEALRETTAGRDPGPSIETARTTILEALRIGPTYYLSHLTLGEVHLLRARATSEDRVKDLQGAQQALERAIQLNPTDPAAYQRLAEVGLLKVSAGDRDGFLLAEATLERARTRVGQDAGWWTRRADLLRARAEAANREVRTPLLRQGLAAAGQAIALNPRAAEAWALMGVLHDALNEPEKGRAAREEAFRLDATLRSRYPW
ncbi:MAG: protein kinase [Holophaga sp.]|nr:protein kinase [Holophaga sp.]